MKQTYMVYEPFLAPSIARYNTQAFISNNSSHRCSQASQPSYSYRQTGRYCIECIKISSLSSDQDTIATQSDLLYDGIIFDMDGTLSVSCIDYKLMRSSIDIPMGDLFTVMETWTEGSRIAKSMDIILDIEATAAAQSSAMPGLIELLSFLKQCSSTTKVGLVTRNTTQSVDAFFDAVGDQWRDVFDVMLTREHPHVKPDKRCLLHFSDVWNIPPYKLLMVGDSTEDVECGNAAGTATCLIAGGGNEVGAAPSASPPGAVPSFTVESLHELKERLENKDTPLGWGAHCISSSESESDVDALAGAPPPGLDFIDWLFTSHSIEGASCSFPRIDASRFPDVPVLDDHPGSKVLHLQCGDGALSKLLFSAGVLVVGADIDNKAALKRGLAAIRVEDLTVSGSLGKAAEIVKSRVFDAVVLLCKNGSGSTMTAMEQQMGTPRGMREVARVLRGGGVLCVEGHEDHVMKILEQCDGGLFEIELQEKVGDGCTMRLMARKKA